MVRIILSLAIVAAVIFTPWFAETVTGDRTGSRTDISTGNYYVGDTVNCFLDQKYSISDECAPQGGMLGTLVFAVVAISAVSAVLGILGLLPFLGRLTSAVTLLAGLVTIAAFAVFMLGSIGGPGGFASVQWGAYLTGGLGLLTFVAGFSGLKGDSRD